MNAALMQAELGKLPIWSGDSSKDGYTIEQWSDRVDRAAETANWDDRDTMNFVYNAFRGPALKWLEALKTFGIDDKSWVAVKAELLEAYSRVQTARTTVVNLADLKQATNESITDFGSRVAIIVEDIKQLMPAASRVPQGVVWPNPIAELAGWAGVGAAHKTAVLQDAADKVRWACFDHLGIQLFVSNLKPVIRDELMKAPPASLNAAIKMARSLEKIQVKSDSAHAHATVAEIQPHTQPQGHDAALDAEIEALSASFQALLKRRNGNNSSRGGRGNGNSQRGRGGRGRGGRGGNTTSYIVCRYCKKPGHLQKVCNSRIKAGAPEVDAQGKPYTNATELEEGGPTDGAAGSLDYSNPWLQQPAPYDYGAAEEIYQDRPDFI